MHLSEYLTQRRRHLSSLAQDDGTCLAKDVASLENPSLAFLTSFPRHQRRQRQTCSSTDVPENRKRLLEGSLSWVESERELAQRNGRLGLRDRRGEEERVTVAVSGSMRKCLSPDCEVCHKQLCLISAPLIKLEPGLLFPWIKLDPTQRWNEQLPVSTPESRPALQVFYAFVHLRAGVLAINAAEEKHFRLLEPDPCKGLLCKGANDPEGGRRLRRLTHSHGPAQCSRKLPWAVPRPARKHNVWARFWAVLHVPW
ncbi:hypothetical protein B0H13DRAFT_1857361 [Mycena leptocephala]|nr:hypothetical protein B0H13DRAFT_1857361 [Mycena leptocephala]